MERLVQLYSGLFSKPEKQENEDGDEANVDAGFRSRWGWLIAVTQVAEMESISLAQVYELNTINFLNDISYLKDKSNYEKEQRRVWLQNQKSNVAS